MNQIRHPFAGDWTLRFEEYLGEFYPNLLKYENEPHETLPPQEVVLGTSGNQWRVRVVALDSSSKADKFARGFVDLQSVASLKGAMQSTNDVDLGLLLVHHHLLSVRKLEYDRQNNWKDLLNSTALVNSGSFVEELASNHIDIALHGHEHASNWGTYGTLEKGGGNTVILGAASGTGVVTSEPNNERHASYNLLELHPDRSITVVIHQWDGAKWDGKRYDLLDSQTVRRTRFLRRSEDRLKTPPTTEIVRYIEFTRQRAGFVQEYRTNWFPDAENNTWSIIAQNSTGQPVDLFVELENPEGKRWNPSERPQFKTSESEEPGTYYYESVIPPSMGEGPFRVDMSYRWQDAALLTAEEFGRVPEEQKDWLRKEGYEYGAASSPLLARSIRLVVRVPPELAPRPDDVGAWIKGPAAEQPLQRADISNCFTILAQGLYSLTVPFPYPKFQYIIAWKPPAARKLAEAERFEEVAIKNGQTLAKAFFETLKGTDLESYVPHVSLYIPAGQRLRRVGHLPETENSSTMPAEYLDLSEVQPIMTRAWWGEVPVRGQRDTDSRDDLRQLGFLDVETALIALPVRIDLTGETMQPWGVVRLGLMGKDPKAYRLLEPENGNALRQVLLQPMLELLVEAGLKYGFEAVETRDG